MASSAPRVVFCCSASGGTGSQATVERAPIGDSRSERRAKIPREALLEPLLRMPRMNTSILRMNVRADGIANLQMVPTQKDDHKLRLYTLIAVAAIGGFLFGYDTGVVSGASILIQAWFSLTDQQLEMVVSSTILCAALGAIAAGPLNTRLGRRPVILIGAFIFAAGSVILGAADSLAVLVLGRVVVGIAVGLASSTTPMFIAELAPKELRGFLVALNNVAIVSGQVSASIVDGAFCQMHGGWRWMLGIGCVPAIIQFLGMLGLPESPRWLLDKGRVNEARRILKSLRPCSNDGERAVDDEFTAMILALDAEKAAQGEARVETARPEVNVVSSPLGDDAFQVQAASSSTDVEGDSKSLVLVKSELELARNGSAYQSPESESNSVVIREKVRQIFAFLNQVRPQLTLGVNLMLLQQFIGINTIMYYSTPILKTAFFSGQSSTTRDEDCLAVWLSAPVAFAQLIGCIAGMQLIDRFGRRFLVLVSLAGCAISLFFMSALFMISDHCSSLSGLTLPPPPPSQHSPSSPPPVAPPSYLQNSICDYTGWLSLVGMSIYLVSFGVGMSPIPWTVNSEIYPLYSRSICVGITTAVNWISNFVVAATFLTLQSPDALTPAGTFGLFAVISVIGAIYLFYNMPETANKSLDEIGELFRKRQ